MSKTTTPKKAICSTMLIMLLAITGLGTLSWPASGKVIGESWAFERSGTYLLRVDGEEAMDAKFYLSPNATLLIVSAELPAPVLLRFGEQDVLTLSGALPEEGSDGSLEISEDVGLRPQGELRRGQDGLPTFTIGARSIRIELGRAHVGLFDLLKIKELLPVYARRATAYDPDQEIISELSNLDIPPIHITIYFGSWCSTCSRHMPKIVRMNEDLEGSHINFSYRGVNKGRDRELDRVNIAMLPTAIVYLRNERQELGRIYGAGWERPEQSLHDILEQITMP